MVATKLRQLKRPFRQERVRQRASWQRISKKGRIPASATKSDHASTPSDHYKQLPPSPPASKYHDDPTPSNPKEISSSKKY